jgi:hypothetical protein
MTIETQEQADFSALRDYRESFLKLWELRSEYVVPNGKAEHAAVLFEVFFQKAEHSIQIFCHNLAGSVYNRPEIKEAVQGAVERGVSIDVVIEAPAEAADLVAVLGESSRSSVKKVHAGVDYPFNFAVVDDHAFRFEPDSDSIKAIACAWNPERAKGLKSLFRGIQSSSEPYNPQLRSARN